MSSHFSSRSRIVPLSLTLAVLVGACGGGGDTSAVGDRFETEADVADTVGASIDGRQIEVYRDPG
ncbi:MAG: hypothetical protein OEO77_12495 [Acidimicrobiia bacterium]|nr:hypothetical protein [Acidimicrobiia bacterium]